VKLLLGVVVVLLLVFAPPASAKIFTVNSGADLHDVNIGDGECDADSGNPVVCTLRAAIEEANEFNDPDEVDVDVVAVALTLGGGGAIGITTNVAITGTASSQPIVTQESSPGNGDRVFDIASGATVGIGNLTIRGGEANTRNNHFGGNIRSSGALTITNSNIEGGSGNSAGGVANVAGSLRIERSTIAGNKAPTEPGAGGDAGAVLNFGSADLPAQLVIDSSTISGNTARLGGGVFSYNNSGNSVTITNSTIAFNDSGDRGGGGGLIIASGTATIRNTIVARNSSPSPGQANCSTDPSAVIGSGGYNVENDTTCGFTSGTDRQNADPLLEPLAFNGGPTRTHALPFGSSAVDTGDPACPLADQRGFPRPLGHGCDTGAFEAIDQTVPETRIDAGPPGPTTDHTPTFTFSSDKPGSQFACSIDSGPVEPCTSPFTTPSLRAGPHTFAVYAIDTQGRADPTPSVVEFVILPVSVDELPPPQQGVTVNVAEVSGTVFVGQRTAAAARNGARGSQKGITFVPLNEAQQIPVGSFLDTRKGTVRLQSAQNRAGKRQSGKFLDGLFQVRQSRKRRARGLTDLVLKGSSFARCGRRGKRASASLSRRQIRRLRANARGRFRTSGSNSSATVRGTIWDITDRCDGTLTRVRRGKVIVRDFRRKKNITLTSGKSYLAKAPR
jgi:hypothetical protein